MPCLECLLFLGTGKAIYLKGCQTFQRTSVTISLQPKIYSRRNLKITLKKVPSLLESFPEAIYLSLKICFISCTSTKEKHTKHNFQPKLSYVDASEHKRQKTPSPCRSPLPSGTEPALLSWPRAAAFLPGTNWFTLNPHLQSQKLLKNTCGTNTTLK